MSKAVGISKEMLLAQMEEALEERQSSDRRKANAELPSNIAEDRRKGDRRTKKAK